LKLLVQLLERNDYTLNVLALFEMLLRLRITFLKLDLHGDHLQIVSYEQAERLWLDVPAYLHWSTLDRRLWSDCNQVPA
jgi:hypothetical protein